MDVIGRNEQCYCGSSKKYKKYCLPKDERKLRNGVKPVILEESLEIKRTAHDLAFGIKQLALTQLEQIKIHLSRKHIIDFAIQVYSKDLLELVNADDMIEHYLKIIQKIMETKKMPNIHLELENFRIRATTFPSLTENERKILRTVAESNLAEYALLSDVQTTDYGSMRVLNEFAYQIINEGVPDNQSVFFIDLIVDTNDKLVNWEFIIEDQEIDDDDDDDDDGHDYDYDYDYVEFNWQPLDELHDEYQKFSHSLHGLEEYSKSQLATALYQEKTIPAKSRDKASYSGLVSNYAGILEQELKLLIAMKEGQKQINDLMMKKINDYLKEKTLPYLSDNIPNLYERLEEIRLIRNQAAHGQGISHGDFLKVKQFVINDQAFEFISWAKIHFEDH